MSLSDRLKLYEEIESHRKRPLIVYVTSKRQGAEGKMASEAMPFLIDQIEAAPDGDGIDLMVASFGGDPMVAWRIMSLLRERYKQVSVLVPQSAYSAATLLALGADEIVMHPNSHLGPIDLQITMAHENGNRAFSTEDVSAFIEFVQTELKIKDPALLSNLFELACREVGALGMGVTARGSKLAQHLGLKLLQMHGSTVWADFSAAEDVYPSVRKKIDKAVCEKVVARLSREIHSHDYPVSRAEAKDISLSIADRDPVLESLIWRAWLDLESEMKEREPYSPMIELMNNATAARHLTASVPQLRMPDHAPVGGGAAGIEEVKNASEQIEAVSTTLVTALVESKKLAYSRLFEGKILAARRPDLNIQYNIFETFNGWKKLHPSCEQKQ